MGYKGFSSFNKSRILGAVWLYDRISRIEIARLTGLDKSTITNIMNRFLEAGLVEEVSEGSPGPSGGRRPVLLSLNRSFGYVAGVEIRPESISSVVVDLGGGIIRERVRARDVGSANLVPEFLGFMQDLRQEMQDNGERLLGIGVGVPGIVNPIEGVILQSIPLGITSPYPFISKIYNCIDIPVFVENDANACAWGELAFRKTERLGNFLSILIELRTEESCRNGLVGAAVGFGIVLGGKVHYGDDFSAGEFRSLFLESDTGTQFTLTRSELSRVLHDRAVYDGFAEELAMNVAMFVNTFALRNVFLVGSVEACTEDLCSRIRDRVLRNWPYPGVVECRVSPSAVGECAVAYGTAGMFLEHYFNRPGVVPGGVVWGLDGLDLLFRRDILMKDDR